MRDFDFENKPIVDIANEIILDAVKRGASDIHFDPYEDDLIIRIRIDGVLYDYAKVPPTHKRNMISRIKMIASMNIMETRLPQDGAIKSRIGGRDIDLRVSSLPTYNGEKVVLRILDYSMSLQGLESLGFSEHNYDKIIKMTEIPNGIVLVTGATGSGKSTTVYSILQKLNTRDVNIITVEDPVEMDINGLNQVQAQEEIGLDFATVLRSILRQDPDIIMIGEIRDTETARIAVRASITGHKVLSTIHTNNALNTIERLTDMDVERYLIGTSLNGIISQKLARKLCPHCRILRETDDYEKSLFKKVLNEDVNKIYDVNPEGCEHCFKGYRDRTAIAEVLLITDNIRTAITTSVPKDEMRKLVYVDGQTRTLLEDGLEKIMNGETSFQELYKLVDMENDLAIHEKYLKNVNKKDRTSKKEDHNKYNKDNNKEQNKVEVFETPILDLNNINNDNKVQDESNEDIVKDNNETNDFNESNTNENKLNIDDTNSDETNNYEDTNIDEVNQGEENNNEMNSSETNDFETLNQDENQFNVNGLADINDTNSDEINNYDNIDEVKNSDEFNQDEENNNEINSNEINSNEINSNEINDFETSNQNENEFNIDELVSINDDNLDETNVNQIESPNEKFSHDFLNNDLVNNSYLDEF